MAVKPRPLKEGVHSSDTASKRSYTLKEVALHESTEDCWLIIHGKVYDVTKWIPSHPGGALIYVKAGQDSTQLFDSYHPLYVRKMLSKYYIGELQRSENDKLDWTSLPYSAANDGEDFYTLLKERVEAYFKQHKINPRMSTAMFVKSFLILSGYCLCYYGAFFASWSWLPCLLCALGMGFLAAEVGVSIQHDGNHGAYTNSCTLGYLMGASLDFVGASSFMWRQQHVVGHHSHTNIEGYDPDIRVKDPDVRCVTKFQPRRWYHQYQHIYLALLYGLLALKSVVFDDFSAYFSGAIGNVKLTPMTSTETLVFLGGKLLYALYMFVLPMIYGRHGTAANLLLWIASQLITGWTLAFMFQVAHVVEEAKFVEPNRSGTGPKVPSGWAAAQVASTTDFSHGSFLWTHISGGLNYQIEHHLFPAVCHVHYPLIRPIVKATCKEFNVPYHCYPSFWSALKAHFKYLAKVGAGDFHLRLGDG